MAIGLTPRSTWPHVLYEDRDAPPEAQSAFVLRWLDPEERAFLEDRSGGIGDGDVYVLRLGTLNLESVRAGLVGWSNFRDAQGEQIPFELTTEPQPCCGRLRRVPTLATLSRLTTLHVRELGEAIRAGQRLSAADLKNSSSPPSLPSAAAATAGTAGDAVVASLQGAGAPTPSA